jgi:thioredoxin-like negative regulator of GroEL
MRPTAFALFLVLLLPAAFVTTAAVSTAAYAGPCCGPPPPEQGGLIVAKASHRILHGARTRKSASYESVMAFAFGVIFCGILAYAGLRKAPITDVGQFFLLRVLAAISAAGVAAVIPGMLHVKIGQGRLFTIRAAGALGVFALIFAVNPPELLRPPGEATLAAMDRDFAQGLYDDASRYADQILKVNPNDAEALNTKGGAAFYAANYPSAAEYFRRAHLSRPDDDIVTSNYANALVETGAYQLAVELFKSIDDGKADRSFTLGRAYLYAGNFSDAQKILEGVPLNYWHGAARILEAAALIAQERDNTPSRSDFRDRANQKFREGYLSDKIYWVGIFSGQQRDVHLTYELPVRLLRSIYHKESGASPTSTR